MRKIIFSTLFILLLLLLTGCSSLKNLINTDMTPNSIFDTTNNSIEKDDPDVIIDEKENTNENSDEAKNTSENSNKNDDTNKTKDEKSTTNESSSKLTIKDYYPFKANAKYIYSGKGTEYASYTSWVDYIKDTRIQLRVNNGGTETVKVIENKNGELKLILSKEESYSREDLTSKPEDKTEVLLKEPLAKGTSWVLSDGRKRYISNIDLPISTSLGNYKTLEVTTEDKSGKTLDYYAPDVGLIKTLFKTSDSEISSTLNKIESNAKLTQSVKFYYPDAAGNKLYFVKKNLSFKTNDFTKLSIEKAFKEVPSKNLGRVLGTNVKINSLYLNKDNMVYIDFSKELISEISAGANYEALILQAITNTIGEYYNVDNVYITVENLPYSSGHIQKKKGEYFTVNSKGSIEIKSTTN